MFTRFVRLCLLLCLCTGFAGAQGLSLTKFNAETTGSIDTDGADHPSLESSGSIAGRFVPIHALSFKAGLSFASEDLAAFLHPSESYNVPGTVAFDGGAIETGNFPNRTVMLAVFTGTYDDPASGSLVRERLKIDISQPEFLDMPAGEKFSSDTDIRGTGLAVTAEPFRGSSVVGAYGYWNAEPNAQSLITMDLRYGTVSDAIRVNAFGGYSYGDAEPSGLVRGGFSSILVSPSGTDLYAEAGIRSTKATQSNVAKHAYFLLEPRLRWTSADVAFSFFAVPNDDEETAETTTYLGSNFLLGIGNVERSGIRGGLSLLGAFDPANPSSVTPFTFSVSPFCAMMIKDFRLTMTLVVNPLKLNDLEQMGEIQISLKAVL